MKKEKGGKSQKWDYKIMSKITSIQTHRDKRIIFLLILSSVILVSLMIWGANVYSKFDKYVDITSKNTIAAMMEQIECSYQMQLDSMFEDTERLENYLFENEDRSIRLSEYADYFRTMENESVQDIVFVDHTGKYICDDGKTGVLDLGDTSGSMFETGDKTAQYCTWRDGEEIFVIAKAYDDFYVNYHEYQVIAFVYNMNKVNDLFVDSAYGGQAKLYVTNSESMVSYTDLETNEGIVRNYNILEHYLDESVIGEEQYKQIVEDFKEGRENCAVIYDGSEKEYFYYRPLAGTEFFLVFEAPCAVVQSALTEYQKKISRLWMLAVVAIAGIVILLAVGVVGAIHTKAWEEYERQMRDLQRESNEQLGRMNKAMKQMIDEYRSEQRQPAVIEPMGEEEKEQTKKMYHTMEIFALSRERFLLVEDNDMSASILKELLENKGAECTRVKSGEQALKMFKRSKPGKYQYILMDVKMPEMDGYETSKRLRKLDHPQAKTIPILAMTYHATAESMRTAAMAGMSGQIEKPVSPMTLALIVTKLKEKGRKHIAADES